MTEYMWPSTMMGPPISALCPPGQCQFGAGLTAVPLLQRFPVSPTSAVLRFGLPDSSKPLGLSTCACILANADIQVTKEDGSVDTESVTRPYTPISTNADVGYVDLLVKNYGEQGKMSRYLNEVLQPGEMVNFKHIDFNVKIQASDLLEKYDHILMLTGGTGITPMIQALHTILPAEKGPSVVMIYGSRVQNDILGKELLHNWQATVGKEKNKFQLVDILSHEPEDSDWKGERGFITKEMIQKYFPYGPEQERILILVCGPPPLYNIFCGPREEPNKVSGVLGEMGYKPEQVYKF